MWLTKKKFYDILTGYEFKPLLRKPDTPTVFLVAGDITLGGET